MRTVKKYFPLMLCLFVINFEQCAKKVTKIPQTLPETSRTRSIAVEPAAQPAPENSFTESMLDSEAKAMFQNIYFDFNKYDIKPEAEQRLTLIAKFMTQRTAIRTKISGNCDERGSAEYNIALGERRASAAKDFLVKFGISGDRIEVNSYGKERLAVVGCTDEACHAKNRRDEFTWTQDKTISLK